VTGLSTRGDLPPLQFDLQILREPRHLTIPQIETIVARLPLGSYCLAINLLHDDDRVGVRRLVKRMRRSWQQWRVDQARIRRLGVIEEGLYSRGATLLAGVDEAGRGPLAGPVVAAAVILRPETTISGLDDSKVLTASAREGLFTTICREALGLGIAFSRAETIDDVGIVNATFSAMRRALSSLGMRPSFVLVDAFHIPDLTLPQVPLIRGDSRSQSIAAASVLAKVARDRYMRRAEGLYPGYGFANHKGYATPSHRKAVQSLGLSPIHRRTFSLKGG